uniref:Uncharacterized protein n=1 Tax=Musa acuminata TaxID=4641 RepID=Q1ENV6_MUSAC|nr:hypothetical protein MA4_82I11.20 [Musa acuminata]
MSQTHCHGLSWNCLRREAPLRPRRELSLRYLSRASSLRYCSTKISPLGISRRVERTTVSPQTTAHRVSGVEQPFASPSGPARGCKRRRRPTRCGRSRRTMSGTGSSASCPPSDPSSAAPLSSPTSPSSAPLASPPMMPSAASAPPALPSLPTLIPFLRSRLGRGSMLWIRGSSASASRSRRSPFPRRTPRTRAWSRGRSWSSATSPMISSLLVSVRDTEHTKIRCTGYVRRQMKTGKFRAP